MSQDDDAPLKMPSLRLDGRVRPAGQVATIRCVAGQSYEVIWLLISRTGPWRYRLSAS